MKHESDCMKLSRYKVRWSEAAKADLLGIVSCIGTEHPRTALSIWDRIESGATRLESLPQRCRVVPELRDFGISTYRELIIPPWRVVF